MSVTRRYHHGNLRAELLSTGLELTRAGGPAALVLRDVTRRLGVSPNAVYRHFADRDALRLALVGEVEQQVLARMHAEAPPPGPVGKRPRETLRGVGLGYIDFALAEPGWFELVFAAVEPRGADDLSEAVALPAPLTALVDALDALVESGELAEEHREGAEWPCWSAVHGFAMLALHGPLQGRPAAELRPAAERTVDAVVTGLLDGR